MVSDRRDFGRMGQGAADLEAQHRALEAAGRAEWERATREGRNVQARAPQEMRELGARAPARKVPSNLTAFSDTTRGRSFAPIGGRLTGSAVSAGSARTNKAAVRNSLNASTTVEEVVVTAPTSRRPQGLNRE